MEENIFAQYVVWHFSDMVKEIAKAWSNYLRFFLNFFSTPFLIKTLFAPWHGLLWSYGRGFSFSRYAQTFISNIFSRFIGAIIRTVLLAIGIIGEVFIFLVGAILLISWIFLPALLVLAFVYGIRFLF